MVLGTVDGMAVFQAGSIIGEGILVFEAVGEAVVSVRVDGVLLDRLSLAATEGLADPGTGIGWVLDSVLTEWAGE